MYVRRQKVGEERTESVVAPLQWINVSHFLGECQKTCRFGSIRGRTGTLPSQSSVRKRATSDRNVSSLQVRSGDASSRSIQLRSTEGPHAVPPGFLEG